jgi:hypothetical protein
MLGLVIVAGALTVILGGLTLLGIRLRRRRLGGSMMGPFDEIWHPAAHHYRFEVEAQQERAIPLPATGDRPGRNRGRTGRA